MAEIPVPITTGSGAASIASDVVSNISYQQIKVVDGTLGSNTALIVNSDGTANVRISGSVATAGGTFTGSVSGTVGASIIGTVPVVQSGTNITSVVSTVPSSVLVGASIFGQLPGGTAVLGSVATLQGTNPWIVTSSIAGGLFPISGSVAAVIVGTPNVNAAGSVVAFQGTTPWVVNFQNSSVVAYQLAGSILATSATVNPAANQSVSGTVQTDVRGSVAVAIISGSIAATFTPPANQSVSGTVNIGTGGPVSVTGTMSVLGTVPVTQSTTPWVITGSVQGSFSPSGNQSVSGTVQVDVRGSVATVIIGGSIATATTNSSVMLLNGANAIGSVTALQGTNPWTVVSSISGGIFPIAGSVAATIVGTPNVNTAGSVVAFQGTNPWIETFSNSSILAVPVGSVVTVFQSSSILAVPVGSIVAVVQASSIVGTYAEDAAAATGDKGVFVLGVRNDTMASVSSADGDYTQFTVGPTGEMLTANSPITKWVSGTASMLGGVPMTCSVTVIAAQGASIFTYITGVQVANLGSASVLVSFGAATSSLIGYTIAPAGGGSNITFPNALKTNANAAFSASISGTASIYVAAQGFISKT